MSAVLAIVRRELQAYFVSPIAYVVSIIFLGIAGAGFFYTVTAYSMLPEFVFELQGLNIRNFVISGQGLTLWVTLGMVVALPALSMRLLSEERKVGTAELLMTSPLTTAQIVIGKFLGTLTVLALILLLTTPYIGLLIWQGEPELAAVVSAYAGYLLFGAVILAIGLFASALTENQIVALLLTWAIFLPLWLVPDLLVGLSGALLDDLLAAVAIGYGMRLFSLGLVDTHYLVLDLSLVFLFLFLCAQVIDSNRWR